MDHQSDRANRLSESMGIGRLVLSESGRILSANRSATEVLLLLEIRLQYGQVLSAARLERAMRIIQSHARWRSFVFESADRMILMHYRAPQGGRRSGDHHILRRPVLYSRPSSGDPAVAI
jgi:hypothetical protein